MLETILANTACESPAESDGKGEVRIRDTCRRIVRDRIPNLLRLYLNPYVAQTCYCLTHQIEAAWPTSSAKNHQVFIANSMEEALNGAIKLARYSSAVSGRPPDGVLWDQDGRLEHFVSSDLQEVGTVCYIPRI